LTDRLAGVSLATMTDVRTRRPPPPLLPIMVTDWAELSPRMLRLSFEGEGIRNLGVSDPAASVRLLVPMPGTTELVIPTWEGNEFLLPDGARPALRTFTPLHIDGDRMDLEIVRHPGGAVSTWAEKANPGTKAALSGPGSGYEIDPGAKRFVLLGDETAIPAIRNLLETLPAHAEVEVHIEAVHSEAELELPSHPQSTINWHVRASEADDSPLVVSVGEWSDVSPSTRIWAGGEASTMQAIRRHLHQSLGVDRDHTSIRGYWKPPR